VHFEIIGPIEHVEVIARGVGVRQRTRLVRAFGRGRWRKLKGEANIVFTTGGPGGLKYTGTKRTASGAGSSRSSDTSTETMKNDTESYVACVRTDGALDLEVGKLYVVRPPQPGDRGEDVRIVDESGDDYLYPASWFVAVEVPEDSARALRAARSSRSGAAG
jgi:hypothetical protein